MPRLVKFLIVIFFLAAILIALSFIFPIFKFKHIECQLDQQACPEEILTQLQSLSGQSFYFTNITAHIQELHLPLFELVEHQQTWPDKLALQFTTQPTNYWLKINNEETYLVSSQNFAMPLGFKNTDYIFQIESWPNPLHQNQVDQNLHQLLLTLNTALKTQELNPRELHIYNANEIKLIFDQNLTVLVSQENLQQQLAKLKIILTELDLATIDLAINHIDLRFNLSILSNQP